MAGIMGDVNKRINGCVWLAGHWLRTGLQWREVVCSGHLTIMSKLSEFTYYVNHVLDYNGNPKN